MRRSVRADACQINLIAGFAGRIRRAGRLSAFAAALALAVLPAVVGAQQQKGRVLILVVDGLRPDYVTEEYMPTLNALAQRGVRGLRHHAVFPTVTRVNGPSIFTGRYPGGHGLLGNTVYIPEVDPRRVLSAADVENLWAIDRATGNRLLTAPSLGELLAANGRVFFAASSGSTGSGTLMNHRGAGAGLVHHEVTVPDSLASIARDVLGAVPAIEAGEPEIALVARAVDAVLRIGIDRADADVLAAWLTEPDGTAHERGIGSPETMAVLRAVDGEVARLLEGLRQRGMLDHTNILVTSDHGFSTRTGTQTIADLLVDAGLKTSAASMDVVVAGDAIHVREGGPERVTEIVRALQRAPWIGPVFTRARTPGDPAGIVPGTLSFVTVSWAHERSADILTSANWTDAPNVHGWRGTALTPGVAGHGTSSPWDIRATFIAAGPAIRHGVASTVPTGNIDITPTALHLAGATIASTFDGRVLTEILRSGPDPATVTVASDSATAETTLDGLTYRMTLQRSRVGTTTYVDGTRVERISRSPKR
jgi:arylsulfatase A-like enzyme